MAIIKEKEIFIGQVGSIYRLRIIVPLQRDFYKINKAGFLSFYHSFFYSINSVYQMQNTISELNQKIS